MSKIKNQIKLFFQIVKESLRGEEHDYTQGNLKRAVFLLSVPMVLEMLMESVFAVVDIFFVSKLGADAIATVGLTESVITLIYALAVGLSAATSAMVSRRVGEKKYQKASKSAYQAIITGIAVSILIAIPGSFFAKDILRLMNASEAIVNDFSGYATIMFGSNAVIMLLFINNAIFRSAGNPVLSMRALWMANIINIILDPIFIFGLGPIPALGIKGAAIATTTGRGIAVIYQFYLLSKGKGRIKLKGINFRPDLGLIAQLFKLSSGTISQHIVATSSWIVLMRIVALYGSAVLAGYTIAIRIIIFVMLPAWGIANAASTLVGQNLGAGQPERAQKSAWIAGRANMFTMGIVSLVLVIWPKFFMGLLSHETDIIHYGSFGLQIIGLGMIFYGLAMTLTNAFNGAGDTQTPFRINLVSFWLIEIPLAWLLATQVGWEQNGVFWAVVIAETFMTAVVLFFFQQGKWKLKQV